MIRIIKAISARSLDPGNGNWVRLPMIAATGRLELTYKTDSAGRLCTANLSATLSRRDDILDDNLILRLTLEDEPQDSVLDLGSPDLPLRLDITETDIVKISATWSRPVR